MKLPEILFRIAYRTYPKAFRLRYEAQAIRLFREMQRTTLARSGWEWARFVARAIGATPVHGVAERLRRRRSGPARTVPRPTLSFWSESMLGQIGKTLRGLARTPTFTIAAVATVALGIGANTLVFSVVNATLLEGLPYPDPERLVHIEGRQIVGEEGMLPLSFLDIQAIAEASQGFDIVTPYTGARSFNMIGDPESENVQGELVGLDYFELLGATPPMGGVWEAGTSERVAILGHGLWTRRFGGNPDLVGGTVNLDGNAYTVVGIAPPGFRGLSDSSELWMPIGLAGALYGGFYLGARPFRWLSALARTSEGTEVGTVAQELNGLAESLRTQYPNANADVGFRMEPLTAVTYGDLERRLGLLTAAAVFVLLLATVNLGGLLLSRGWARRRELAVRAALGASQKRLLAVPTGDAAALTSLGGIVGLGGVAIFGPSLVRLAAPDLPTFVNPFPDLRVIGAMAAVIALAAAGAALIPGLMALRTNATGALGRSARGATSGRGQGRVLNGIVMTQVAVALALLVMVGGTFDQFRALMNTPLGFEPDGVLTLKMDVKSQRLATGPAYRDFAAELLETARAVPGVEAASLVGPHLPVGDWNAAWVAPEERIARGLDPDGIIVVTRNVSPGYFETMRQPLLKGRDFVPGDVPPNEPVILVSESFEERYLEGDGIGDRVKLSRPNENGMFARVIGVVGDVHDGGPGGIGRPTDLNIYYTLNQFPARTPPVLNLMVRSRGDGEALTRSLRDLQQRVQPDIPFYDIAWMDGLIDRQNAGRRAVVLVMGSFGGLAALLAAVGLFGLLTYSVARRRREVGIRRALGASGSSIVRQVVGSAMSVVAFGTVVGAGVLWLVGSRLDVVQAAGSPSGGRIALAVLVLIGVALLSSLLPSLRAVRIQPTETLMEE